MKPRKRYRTPPLTETLEALDNYAAFSPEAREAALLLWGQEAGISKISLDHLSRLYFGRGSR